MSPGVGVGVGGSISKNFKVKVSYVMGKVLSGELSCPFDSSCCLSYKWWSTLKGEDLLP